MNYEEIRQTQEVLYKEEETARISAENNMAIIGWFIQLIYTKNLYDGYMDPYIGTIKQRLSKEELKRYPPKDRAKVKAKGKTMLKAFSTYNSSSVEIKKIMELNPKLGPIFDTLGDEFWDDYHNITIDVVSKHIAKAAVEFEKVI